MDKNISARRVMYLYFEHEKIYCKLLLNINNNNSYLLINCTNRRYLAKSYFFS